jgi:hypothetical protein
MNFLISRILFLRNLRHKFSIPRNFAHAWLIPVILSILAVGFAVGAENRIETGYADAAGFMELISPDSLSRPLESDYFASVGGLFELNGAKADQVCGVLSNVNQTERNVIGGHPYLLSIPISVIFQFIPVNESWIAAVLLSISIFGGLLALQVFMRKNGQGLISQILILIAIMCYPVLLRSSIGQIYFDRLLFGSVVGLILLIWWMRYRSTKVWPYVVGLLILTALISERGAMLSGLLGVGYVILLFGSGAVKTREVRWVFLCASGALLWAFIWSTKIQESVYYGSLTPMKMIRDYLSIIVHPTRPPLQGFLLASLTLLVLGLASGRLILLAFLTLSMNVTVPVTLLSLDNFYTHYHQVYLPVIVASAVIGFTQISNYLARNYEKKASTLQSLMGVALLVTSLMVWSSTALETNVGTRSLLRSTWFPIGSSSHEIASQGARSRSEVAKYAVEVGRKQGNGDNRPITSAPEPIMPALFLAGAKDVEYWPVGVGVAEIVIAPYINGIPNVFPYSDPQGTAGVLSKCVQSALDERYVLVKTFGDSPASETRIYRKNRVN